VKFSKKLKSLQYFIMLEKEELVFYKMQALGNDFVIIEGKTPVKEEILRICNRNYGIGCDQLIIIDNFSSGEVEIFNQDSSRAANCGNGFRALGLLNYIINGKKASNFRISGRQIQTRIVKAEKDYKGVVEAELGSFTKTIVEPGITEAFIGNKHLVIDRAIKPDIDCEKLSKEKDLNITTFLYQGDKVKARVYERGVGETAACGTAAAALHLALGRDEDTLVFFEKSQAELRAGIRDKSLYIIGEAELVYQGNFYLRNDY